MKSIGIISLGCDKNRVDSENMLFYLNEAGHVITDNFDAAEIIIVNTCAFIGSARAEAIDNILFAIAKKEAKCEKVIVTGCLPQKYVDELKTELNEVDAFLGTKNYKTICETITKLYETNIDNKVCNTSKQDPDNMVNRITTTPQHYAYLKISDGCDNKCTFCTIPSIRGRYISRSMESLVEETTKLVRNGVKELIIVAQDVTRYGFDLYGDYKLIELLKLLVKTDIEKIRLMYCYPELVTDELIRFISTEDKIVKYIDIPLQHVSNKILKRMNRRSTKESIVELISKIKSVDSRIAIRTTFMVGFPGETEEEFGELVEFLTNFPLEHVGIFAFSKEENTPSYKLKEQVKLSVKKKRVKILGELHYSNTLKANSKLVGQVVSVIYEDIDYNRNLFVGRTQQNAPSIDSLVYFEADFVDVGECYDILITGFDGYDLIGEKQQ